MRTAATTAKADPHDSPSVPMHHRIGASRVLVQRKLTVNTPGDTYEQEADRIAEQVMRPTPRTSLVSQSLSHLAGVQRKCVDCEQKDDEDVRRKETGGATTNTLAAPGAVSQVLASGGGQPLDRGTRHFMESRIGLDFSRVRIHTGGRAEASAASIQARAYAAGEQIVFGQGEYQPTSDQGRRLLAHELAHVGQQRDRATGVQRAGFGDVLLAEKYHETIATVRSSDKFRAVGLTHMSTIEAIIEQLDKEPSISVRLSRAGMLENVLARTATKEQIDGAKEAFAELAVDQAKISALLDALSKPLLGYTASGFDFSDRFFKRVFREFRERVVTNVR